MREKTTKKIMGIHKKSLKITFFQHGINFDLTTRAVWKIVLTAKADIVLEGSGSML